MGIMVSVLLSYVGAVELAYVIRDIAHQIYLHDKQNDNNNSDDDDLKRYQERLRKSIADAMESIDIEANENLTQMQDGVVYDNGYRVESVENLDSIQQQQIENAKNDNKNNSSDTNEFLKNERMANENASSIKPKLSEESSSYEPLSPQSSAEMPDIHFDEYNHSDQPISNDQYSEEYLRSMDGVKFRPLVRDDGTGRRRAYKKRQQSSSSTSSEQPSRRPSREDELKMFTSLEEEEFEAIKKDGNYTPIQYSSDPNLKVHKKHSRRHKRSPAREYAGSSDNMNRRNSSDIDDNERTDPWGDVQPNQFHDTDLWKRERANSIAEETEDVKTETENGTADQRFNKSLRVDEKSERDCFSPVGKKTPRMSSFEEASDSQHTLAINALKRQNSKENTLNETNVNAGKNVSTDNSNLNIDNESLLLVEPEPLFANTATNTITEHITSLPVITPPIDSPAETHQSEIIFQIDDVPDDMTETEKIQEFISYIEKLDDKEVDQQIENEKYQFKEFLDHPQRLRHPSYNIDDKDLDSFVDITNFIENEQKLEVMTRQKNNELPPKKSYESSLTVNVDDIIEPEIVSENAYKTELEEVVEPLIVPKKAYKVTSKQTTESDSNLPSNKNFDSIENKKLDKVFNVNRQESNFSTISLESGSQFTIDVRQKSRSPCPSTSYSRETSLQSPYTGSTDRRSPSFERHLIRQPNSFDDLEYIHGRDDWQDISSINIHHQIESDNYHHFRRYSETAETLEYIKGRDDWTQFMQSQTLAGINENEDRSRSSFSIRKEVDSDEYHHTRRFSEALDLAYRSFVRTNSGGILFVAQGSALNGHERSPYHLLRADIERNEFMKLYSWDEEQQKQRSSNEKFDTFITYRNDFRSMSESRDISEMKMIREEQRAWSKTKETKIVHSETVEHRIETETIVNQVIEDAVDIVTNQSHSRNIEREDTTITEGNTAENVYDVEITPGEDTIEFVVWDINSDGREDDDSLQDYEILDENLSPSVDISNPDTVDYSTADLKPDETILSDKDSSPKPTLKKSKRIDDLVEAERCSIDLTDEKDLLFEKLKTIDNGKVDESMSDTMTDKTKSFLEAEISSGSRLLSDLDNTAFEKMDSIDKTKMFKSNEAAESNQVPIEFHQSKKPPINVTVERPVKIVKPTNQADGIRNIRIPRHSAGVDELLKDTSLSPWFHK